MIRLAIASALICMIASCTTLSPDRDYFKAADEAIHRLLAHPETIRHDILTQRVEVLWHHRQLTLTAVIERDGDKRSLVLLDNLGLKVLAVASEGGRITHQFRSPMLPLKVRPEWLLFDLQLAYGKMAELAPVLSGQWRLEQIHCLRKLFYRGRLVKQVSRQSPDCNANRADSYEKSTGATQVTDLVLGYKLNILPVAAENLSAAPKARHVSASD